MRGAALACKFVGHVVPCEHRRGHEFVVADLLLHDLRLALRCQAVSDDAAENNPADGVKVAALVVTSQVVSKQATERCADSSPSTVRLR